MLVLSWGLLINFGGQSMKALYSDYMTITDMAQPRQNFQKLVAHMPRGLQHFESNILWDLYTDKLHNCEIIAIN